MAKRWVKGPALDVMKSLSPKESANTHIHKEGVFLRGDEVLLDLSEQPDRRRKASRHYGVKRPPYVGILIPETICRVPALRVRLKGSKSRSSGNPYDQWGFWRHVVGWRRP